ncbi:MAG: glycosyltransferase family 2 protein [Blastocatellia bacterium]|nr:glycosyltransferase family 2 protein [Blastocatellia bacterium]
MKSAPLVHIIVLNFRMREIVGRCLTSLRSLTYPNYRVIVVDNDSGDGIEAFVSERFPEAGMIANPVNSGYTGGNNRGMRHALDAGADYVLILNPDTEVVNDDFLTAMVAYAEAHPELGIAGPRVFLRERGEIQNTVLFPPGFWRSVFNWFWYRIDPASFVFSGDEVVDARVLNGVCLLIRAECLRRIGLFDEDLFMYIEDADMDWRARQAGWAVRYLPIDSVIHLQKQDGYHMTSQVSFLLKRNSVYYLCKTGRRFDAWGYALFSVLLLLLRGLLTRSRRGFEEYAEFARRLASAYLVVLRGRRLDKDFGPPY